jgi:hypothetical protein
MGLLLPADAAGISSVAANQHPPANFDNIMPINAGRRHRRRGAGVGMVGRVNAGVEREVWG